MFQINWFDIFRYFYIHKKFIHNVYLIFNPLKQRVTRDLRLPLYYTGLTEVAVVREKEGKPLIYQLDRDYSITIELEMEPESVSWFIIE